MGSPTARSYLAWRWRRYGFWCGRLGIQPWRLSWLGPVHTYSLRFTRRDRTNW